MDMEGTSRLKIFTGTAHPALAKEISDYIGVPLGKSLCGRFNNGEIQVMINESVRGKDCFIIQPTGSPVNDNLMEMLIMVDALKRASARNITVVVPYYGYARQDRKAGPREPITARLVANLLERAGVNRIITLDLHQGQIQGFFDIPVNHLSALPLFGQYYNDMHFDTDNLVVVSPDVGRAKAAKKLSDMLGCDLAIAHKGRPRHNAAEVMGIIGDIKGKTCIINDDMIDTAGTICEAVRTLNNAGAKSVTLVAPHGLLSGPAVERLRDCGAREIVLTDTVPVPEEKRLPNMTVLSVAPLLAAGIRSVFESGSVSTLLNGLPEDMRPRNIYA